MPGLVGEIGADDLFPSRADAQAVRRLVVGSEREALPHRRRFRVGHFLAVVQGVLAFGDLLDPIGEAAHELPVVVRVARREVEVPVRGDGSHGTRRHAQLAFQARVVRDRLAIGGGLGGDQDGAQQDEVAEPGVDDVAVDAHVPQARSDGDRLVRHDPNLPTRKAVHLHREAHRRVQRPNPLALQGRHDLAGDLVDVIAGVVEFEVGDRPGRDCGSAPGSSGRRS